MYTREKEGSRRGRDIRSRYPIGKDEGERCNCGVGTGLKLQNFCDLECERRAGKALEIERQVRAG
jgi:predicted methyltransferase